MASCGCGHWNCLICCAEQIGFFARPEHAAQAIEAADERGFPLARHEIDGQDTGDVIAGDTGD